MIQPSSDDTSELLLHKGLAFFGTICASVSHELNNVISIIDQTNGLLEDLIAGTEHGTPITTEHLARVQQSIQKHTARGLEIIRRLNKFAHSIDEPVVEFDVNETVANLAALASRFAGLRRVNLEVRVADEKQMLTGNPYFLQEALFAAMQLALDTAEKNSEISIETADGTPGSIVTLTCPGVIVDRSLFESGFYRLLLDKTNGTLDVSEAGETTVFRFHFRDKT